MTSAGLLGFPNVGKTTLFNALTGLEAFTAPHPYTTTQPRLGTVRMPDRVLDRLAILEGSRKVTHAGLDLVDLPAVRSGSIRGIGAGREPDLLLAVLRAHDSEAVPVGEHGTDPAGQADDLLVEVALSDLEVFERRNERLTKEAAADPHLRPVAEAVTRGTERLGEGVPLRAVGLVGCRDPGLSRHGPAQPAAVRVGGQRRRGRQRERGAGRTGS